VYEGESRRVEDNRQIGQLDVKGIPKGPRGQQVEVRFTFDLNGILGVEARVVATGQTFSAIFTRDSRVLSKGELGRAAKRLAKLREDPRRQPRHRDLLLRAELLWKDLPPEGRENLAYAMDTFESALETRNPAEILAAFRVLKQECDAWDDGERW